jgi:hypothetical protein
MKAKQFFTENPIKRQQARTIPAMSNASITKVPAITKVPTQKKGATTSGDFSSIVIISRLLILQAERMARARVPRISTTSRRSKPQEIVSTSLNICSVLLPMKSCPVSHKHDSITN